MAAIANITVFDGAASPVSHTLVAVSVSRPNKTSVLAEWREKLASVPDYAQVRASLLIEVLPTGVYRITAESVVPVMESVSGQNAAGYTAAPKVAYENTLRSVGLFHQRSTVTDRRLARQIMVNLMGNISTTVAAATSGPLPDAFDSLISPT